MKPNTGHSQAWMFDSRDGDPYRTMGDLTVLKATDENTDGSFSMIEERIPAGSSPLVHIHSEDDELFYVLSGRVTFEVGGEPITATPGSTVYAPRYPSQLRERGRDPLAHADVRTRVERFFAEVGRPAESWTIPIEGPIEEEIAKIDALAGQYGFDLVGPPLNAGR